MPLLGSSFKMSFGKVALNGGMPFQIYVSKFPGNLCSLSGRFCSEIHAENCCSQSSDLRDFLQKSIGNAVIYDIITILSGICSLVFPGMTNTFADEFLIITVFQDHGLLLLVTFVKVFAYTLDRKHQRRITINDKFTVPDHIP